jgi:hypothetical protein
MMGSWSFSSTSKEEATMKKALLIAAAVMFIAGAASAQVLPPVGYIGIFADATHNTDPAANFVCPAQYGQCQGWIWCLPDAAGLQAAEFAVSLPATMVQLASVKNPAIAVELGALATGISVAFAEGQCQMDWTWLYQLTYMVLAPVPQKVEIIPHPGTLPEPAYQFATCALGYPIVPCIYLTPLYVCWTPSPIGVEDTNWGAIKALF